jgi:hypothetical protein
MHGTEFYKRDDRDVKFVLKEHLGIVNSWN